MKTLLTRLTCTLCLLTTPLQAAVVDAGPGGFTLENSVQVPVPPAAAWTALVERIGQWWPADHTWTGRAENLRLEPRAGGCFCERGENQDVEHLRVVFVQPPALLRLTGGLGPLQGLGLHGVLEWRLAQAEGGTRITLWYRAGGYTPEGLAPWAPVVDAVQAQQLGGLARHLGTP
jgi:uncharacterized protein YndB with AHSA1/START domain